MISPTCRCQALHHHALRVAVLAEASSSPWTIAGYSASQKFVMPSGFG